jgi:sulfatase modifying factor 1
MKNYILIFIISLILVGFTGKDKPYKGFNIKSFENSLVLIPKGYFVMGTCDEDIPYIGEPCRQVHVDSFYISKYEVSNAQYLEFLSEISKIDTNYYKTMLPDTLVWREKSVYNEPFVDYYLRHPHFSNYPVVGMSYKQAESFCNWLTEKYLHESTRKHKNVCFKLPTEEQWSFAARGKIDLSPFPWKGIEMQDKNGKWLANFWVVSQSSIGRDSMYIKNVYGRFEKKEFKIASGGFLSGVNLYSNNNLDITIPVNSFEPNGYGLYNMAGNVEEFMKEKGKTHGGSWHDTGYYLQNSTFETYDTLHSASAERGFRFVMEITK